MADDAYADRRRRLQARLRTIDADAVVCAPSRNLQYLTGFNTEPSERHFLLVVPASGPPTALVPALEETAVREATNVTAVHTWRDSDDPRAAIRSLLTSLGVRDGRLLVDDTMWAQFTQDLRAVAPDATWGLASEALRTLRITKDESELDALRAAAATADATVEDLRARDDVIGTTEAALAAWIRDRLAAHGGSGVAFEPIVAAGENGAKPHHSHGDRVIHAGDSVICDFGTRVDGYPSDTTRTFVAGGDPPAAYEQIHETVRDAQAAGIDAIEPGVTTGAVDGAARSVIDASGYGDAFVHRTGHGVGLEVHEPPYVVADGECTLEPGMVCSVEPGIYLEGRFGCRIEDLVLVTDDGAKRLNTTDRGWEW